MSAIEEEPTQTQTAEEVAAAKAYEERLAALKQARQEREAAERSQVNRELNRGCLVSGVGMTIATVGLGVVVYGLVRYGFAIGVFNNNEGSIYMKIGLLLMVIGVAISGSTIDRYNSLKKRPEFARFVRRLDQDRAEQKAQKIKIAAKATKAKENEKEKKIDE